MTVHRSRFASHTCHLFPCSTVVDLIAVPGVLGPSLSRPAKITARLGAGSGYKTCCRRGRGKCLASGPCHAMMRRASSYPSIGAV